MPARFRWRGLCGAAFACFATACAGHAPPALSIPNVPATDTKTLTQIFEQIDKLEKSTVELSQYKQYQDLFPWFLASGFGLLALQMVLAESVGRRLP